MTSTNTVNYAEVLTNYISGTSAKSLTQYSQKRLDGMKKYLFISNLGNIDRAYNKIDAELSACNAYMKAAAEADFEADAKGGYGQGSQELIEQYGFRGGIKDVTIMIEEFFNANNDDFEQMFGTKFKPNWIGKDADTPKSSEPLSSKEKAELKKKYLGA